MSSVFESTIAGAPRSMRIPGHVNNDSGAM
jgi:hypothetical protein